MLNENQPLSIVLDNLRVPPGDLTYGEYQKLFLQLLEVLEDLAAAVQSGHWTTARAIIDQMEVK